MEIKFKITLKCLAKIMTQALSLLKIQTKNRNRKTLITR